LGFNGLYVSPRDASIAYSGLGSLQLTTGALSNFVFVESTAVPTTVNAGVGNVLVDVSAQAENLDNLPAALTVNGNGADALLVNDQNNPNFVAPTQDTITSTTLTRVALGFNGLYVSPRDASIAYSGLGSLQLTTGALPNFVFVESTAAPTTVSAGGGNVLVDVSSQAENLDNLPAALTVDGNGADALLVNDQNDPNQAQTQYTLTSSILTRTAVDPLGDPRGASVGYSGLASVELDTGAFANIVRIEGSAVPTTVTMGAGGNDTVDLGNSANSLDDLLGPVTVHGNTTTALEVNDQGTTASQAYNVTSGAVSRASATSPLTVTQTITFTELASLLLNTGRGGTDNGNVVTVQSTAGGTPVNIVHASVSGNTRFQALGVPMAILTLTGNDLSDTLQGTVAGPNDWQFTGPASGILNGTVYYTEIPNPSSVAVPIGPGDQASIDGQTIN
ncbi:MAG: hypothetical protein ACREHD_22910, partial [Pirellulales bacterium]